MYKRSPVRSPLRDVLKSKFQERMKAQRDNVVGRRRNIQVEGREMVEQEVRKMVKDEVAAWRGGRRCLSFGYSSGDIEEALRDVEDIENELLAEIYGIDFNYEDNLLAMQRNVVCPMCQVDRMEDRQASGMIRCRGKTCGLAIICVGGLDTFQGDLDLVVERHGENCRELLQFEKGDNCLLANCYNCDFCQALGGF